ncbi:MAG: hypothetical protein VKL60_18120, partial [Sphaerospermopsis sp.]|nr:hypothetical protein [Sphaerospermopsis sp.]
NDAFNQINTSQSQALSYQDPWAKAGGSGLAALTGLLTGTSYDYATGQSTPLSQEQRNNLFYQNPSYQFTLDQAMKAVQASQAAKGNLLSGGAEKEIAQYSSGLASQTYNDYLNQLFQLTGMGQQADTAKSNIVTGLASPLADARYSSSIAGNVAGNKIISLLATLGGAAAGSGSSGGSTSGGGGSGGGGTYNPSILMAAGGA